MSSRRFANNGLVSKMSKPDWATRLQRTFARKYDAGFAKGLMFGKAVGARDERDRIVALLEGYAGKECGFGVEHDLIALIKGESK